MCVEFVNFWFLTLPPPPPGLKFLRVEIISPFVFPPPGASRRPPPRALQTRGHRRRPPLSIRAALAHGRSFAPVHVYLWNDVNTDSLWTDGRTKVSCFMRVVLFKKVNERVIIILCMVEKLQRYHVGVRFSCWFGGGGILRLYNLNVEGTNTRDRPKMPARKSEIFKRYSEDFPRAPDVSSTRSRTAGFSDSSQFHSGHPPHGGRVHGTAKVKWKF